MNILEYLNQIKQKFNSGEAREHSYRPVLENYLESLYEENISIINEPKRQACGAPDFIIYKQHRKTQIPLGYIETKDIGKNLDDLAKTDQLKRYKESLDNLIFTDYLDFVFYKEGKQYERVQIAKIAEGQIVFLDENFQKLEQLLDNFIIFSGQTIKSAKDLAMIMAKKAKLMRESFYKALTSEDDIGIKQQLQAFKKILISDITEERFANIYAQTICYGLFTARLHDKTLDTFSREESYNLIPKSNPFLRQLFLYVATNIEDEIRWTVDELCEVFRHTNVKEILSNFGKSSGRNDPIVHFYEDFLKEFDPEVRKARGVWYTPEPVVNFIIRAIDEVLKTHFDLKDGIADSSKIKIKREISSITDKRTKSGKAVEEVEVHKVQLLDIATGTGTFVAEVIKQIYHNNYEGQEGMWSKYVDESLLPRLHGFEILMASYAMCHLKIDLLLSETGYKPQNDKAPERLGVYLTNSLEESHKNYDDLFGFMYELSNEAKQASRIKKETPVMVAFGNPPYSGESQNKNDFIMDLMEYYKQEPSGGKLQERNSKWINDDYVKFLRLGEYYINKNGEGILAYITNHGYLDNPTFRGMRWHLLNTFDHIYIIDLHGNSKKKETAPDGSKDDNVFDIMQGVAIIIGVKTKENQNKLAKVHHIDFYGKRKDKYERLWENDLKDLEFKELENKAPHYLFIPKNYVIEESYIKGISLKSLFIKNGVGICSKRDKIAYQETKNDLISVLDDFKNLEEQAIKEKYKITKESRDQKVSLAKENVIQFGIDDSYLVKSQYRPFDEKWVYHTNKVRGFVVYPVFEIMQNMKNDNIGLCFIRNEQGINRYDHAFISNKIVDLHLFSSISGCILAPLYRYEQENTLDKKQRYPNLNSEIIKEISNKLGLKFIEDHELPEAKNKDNFSPLDLLDYIYAILHSPTYREKYKEFLKIDFPRVPYPENQETFWQLIDLGGQIRQLHLMEGERFDGIKGLITKYPIAGSNKVETINAKSFVIDPDNPDLGKVYTNKDQYFDNVPLIAWQFYIGGYQPAQKWLKDRKERELSHDDILHYQKIILALFETDRLMQEIDKFIKL
jgi:predicted helicase